MTLGILAAQAGLELQGILPDAAWLTGNACYASHASLESQRLNIEGIYYFGCQGINLSKVQEVIPLKVGDAIEVNASEIRALKAKISDLISKAIGEPPTDVAFAFADKTCYCYIGLRGKNFHSPSTTPVGPRDESKLPEKLLERYLEISQASLKGLKPNSGSEKLKARLLKEELQKEAQKSADLLVKVLSFSKETLQRKVAVNCLGLIAKSKQQIEAIAKATNDVDAGVRAEAMSVLMEIGRKDDSRADLVPTSQFVQLLNSGSWGERNKACVLASIYSNLKSPGLNDELKDKALPSLLEVASWDADHSRPALYTLGRVCGMSNGQIGDLLKSGKGGQILAAAEALLPKKVAEDISKNLAISSKQEVRKPAPKADIPDGIYLVLSESFQKSHFHPSSKNSELVLVNDYHFLSPEERDKTEYLMVSQKKFVPMILKMEPNKETDERGRPKLLISLSDEQIKPLEDFTGHHKGKRVAIVVGGEVVTVHKIREAIKGGLLQITRCTDNGCEAIYSQLAGKVKK